ncbi:MAG: hypothetical protein LBU65_16995 [Planctomycetaceae bacterium]|jgi:hypothetical protein|nr:hypothetical protein [Planctomycetaceae bacterium]
MLLKLLFGHTLRNLILTVAVAAGSSYYASRWFSSTPSQPIRPVPVALQQAVGDFCKNVYETFPASQRVLRPMLLIPLHQDRKSLVTDNLQSVINSNAQYRTIDKTTFDKVRDTLKTQIGFGSSISETVMSLTPAELA